MFFLIYGSPFLAFMLIFGFLLLALVLYLFAVSSRKTYKCPVCGETIQVEYMQTNRCGMCGSQLKEKE